LHSEYPIALPEIEMKPDSAVEMNCFWEGRREFQKDAAVSKKNWVSIHLVLDSRMGLFPESLLEPDTPTQPFQPKKGSVA
jgi:hypothetical protein